LFVDSFHAPHIASSSVPWYPVANPLLSIAEIGESLRWDWEFIGRRQPRHQASTGTREGTPLRHGRM
jgi:hypothetical protein